MASNSTSFALSPRGDVFPRFAFLAITKDKVNCTHHWKDGETLRKRTDTLSSETAGQFIITLRGLGYTDVPAL